MSISLWDLIVRSLVELSNGDINSTLATTLSTAGVVSPDATVILIWSVDRGVRVRVTEPDAVAA